MKNKYLHVDLQDVTHSCEYLNFRAFTEMSYVFTWLSHPVHTEEMTTELLHEQIKYYFIQIFFIHTARVNYGNNKMCINKSEVRIVHYCVATVSKYVIGGCTSKKQSKRRLHVPSAGKRNLSSSQENWTSGLEKMVLWFCSDYTAASSQKDVDWWLLHSF